MDSSQPPSVTGGEIVHTHLNHTRSTVDEGTERQDFISVAKNGASLSRDDCTSETEGLIAECFPHESASKNSYRDNHPSKRSASLCSSFTFTFGSSTLVCDSSSSSENSTFTASYGGAPYCSMVLGRSKFHRSRSPILHESYRETRESSEGAISSTSSSCSSVDTAPQKVTETHSAPPSPCHSSRSYVWPNDSSPSHRFSSSSPSPIPVPVGACATPSPNTVTKTLPSLAPPSSEWCVRSSPSFVVTHDATWMGLTPSLCGTEVSHPDVAVAPLRVQETWRGAGLRSRQASETEWGGSEIECTGAPIPHAMRSIFSFFAESSPVSPSPMDDQGRKESSCGPRSGPLSHWMRRAVARSSLPSSWEEVQKEKEEVVARHPSTPDEEDKGGLVWGSRTSRSGTKEDARQTGRRSTEEYKIPIREAEETEHTPLSRYASSVARTLFLPHTSCTTEGVEVDNQRRPQSPQQAMLLTSREIEKIERAIRYPGGHSNSSPLSPNAWCPSPPVSATTPPSVLRQYRTRSPSMSPHCAGAEAASSSTISDASQGEVASLVNCMQNVLLMENAWHTRKRNTTSAITAGVRSLSIIASDTHSEKEDPTSGGFSSFDGCSHRKDGTPRRTVPSEKWEAWSRERQLLWVGEEGEEGKGFPRKRVTGRSQRHVRGEKTPTPVGQSLRALERKHTLVQGKEKTSGRPGVLHRDRYIPSLVSLIKGEGRMASGGECVEREEETREKRTPLHGDVCLHRKTNEEEKRARCVVPTVLERLFQIKDVEEEEEEEMTTPQQQKNPVTWMTEEKHHRGKAAKQSGEWTSTPRYRARKADSSLSFTPFHTPSLRCRSATPLRKTLLSCSSRNVTTRDGEATGCSGSSPTAITTSFVFSSPILLSSLTEAIGTEGSTVTVCTPFSTDISKGDKVSEGGKRQTSKGRSSFERLFQPLETFWMHQQEKLQEGDRHSSPPHSTSSSPQTSPNSRHTTQFLRRIKEDDGSSALDSAAGKRGEEDDKNGKEKDRVELVEVVLAKEGGRSAAKASFQPTSDTVSFQKAPPLISKASQGKRMNSESSPAGEKAPFLPSSSLLSSRLPAKQFAQKNTFQALQNDASCTFRPVISPLAQRMHSRPHRCEALYREYARRAQLQEEAQKMAEGKENREHRFQPLLNSNRSRESLLHVSNYKKLEEMRKRKEEKLKQQWEAERLEKERREIQECTFQPQTTKVPLFVQQMACEYALLKNRAAENTRKTESTRRKVHRELY